MDTGLKINMIAKHYNLSLRELADKAGVGRGAIQTYTRLSAQKSPAKVPLEVAISICRSFPDINRDWFFFDEGNMIDDTGRNTSGKDEYKEKYYEVLEKYTTVQEELIECIKGYTDGLPPLRTPVRTTG